MSSQVFPAVAAVVLGLLVGFVLFVPLVAVSYRRRGTLTPARFALWAAALVYFLALWTYTLLPLPASDSYACAPAVLSLAPTIDDVAAAFAHGRPWTDVRLLQVVFNVALFVPAGIFVRLLARRGVVTALLVGGAVSLLIELTQVTGVWGVFPCAYRMFDVGDLVTNTSGAVIGAAVALLIPGRAGGVERLPGADEPRPVTRGRRLLAMLCDVLAASVVAALAGTAVQVWLQYVARDRDAVLDGVIAGLANTATPIAVTLVLTLATGRSIGDLAVQLRYRGDVLPAPLARLLRWAGGIGGILVANTLPSPFSLVGGLLVLLGVVLVFTTDRGRGLPGVVSAQRLEDARSRY
ncbi:MULTISPECIES: VanZ family protein [unclassified Microbacterium]|uniref:VanZ family protein n=1 Tax=unclassified Microbacterium TaxID=2609290 RepID=UPI003863CB36